jgi:hypothetical protein
MDPAAEALLGLAAVGGLGGVWIIREEANGAAEG